MPWRCRPRWATGARRTGSAAFRTRSAGWSPGAGCSRTPAGRKANSWRDCSLTGELPWHPSRRPAQRGRPPAEEGPEAQRRGVEGLRLGGGAVALAAQSGRRRDGAGGRRLPPGGQRGAAVVQAGANGQPGAGAVGLRQADARAGRQPGGRRSRALQQGRTPQRPAATGSNRPSSRPAERAGPAGGPLSSLSPRPHSAAAPGAIRPESRKTMCPGGLLWDVKHPSCLH